MSSPACFVRPRHAPNLDNTRPRTGQEKSSLAAAGGAGCGAGRGAGCRRAGAGGGPGAGAGGGDVGAGPSSWAQANASIAATQASVAGIEPASRIVRSGIPRRSAGRASRPSDARHRCPPSTADEATARLARGKLDRRPHKHDGLGPLARRGRARRRAPGGRHRVRAEAPARARAAEPRARPHRIAPGQDLEASGLLRRIERLGYRRTRSPTPALGEYFRGDERLVIHRREFLGPAGPVPPERIELRLGWDRQIAAIRDEQGRVQDEALLDPETLGALADDAPVDRVLVRLGDLPRHLIDTLLVVEDRRFYEHHGVDLRRLGGALLANLRARGVREGGSTITQQLVKNVFLTRERTLLRKLHEAWLALRVERAHDKNEILEAYLNTIYLGQRGPVSVVGVEAAARHYFGHSARTLDLGESALLVGMIRGPGFYSPFTHPDRALERRKHVLRMLAKAGVVSESEAAAAARRPLGNVAKPPAAPRPAWFLAKLERDLAAELPAVDLREDRVVVFTGMDAELQLAAENAIRHGVEELEASFPRLKRSENRLQAALVALDPMSGGILAYVGGRSWAESQFDRVAQARRQPGRRVQHGVVRA